MRNKRNTTHNVKTNDSSEAVMTVIIGKEQAQVDYTLPHKPTEDVKSHSFVIIFKQLILNLHDH